MVALSPGAFNLPNSLTALRIALTPLVAILVLFAYTKTALIVFSFAALTDIIDGLLARRLNKETELGKNLDAIADKFMLVVSFAVLAVTGMVPLWLFIIVAFRDFFVVSTISIIRFSGITLDTTPAHSGKAATFTQIMAVIAALLLAGNPATSLFFLAAGTLTIINSAEYFLRAADTVLNRRSGAGRHRSYIPFRSLQK